MSTARAVVLEIPKPSKVEKQRETENKRNPRGVFEKVRGSDIWWIRYVDAQGRLRRERAPSKSAAVILYRKRKTEALQGKKLPETLRQAAISFKEIAETCIADIERRYSRPADDVARLRAAIEWFGTREAVGLTPGEIEAKLNAVADVRGWGDSTVNHYRSVLSLTYRIAKRDGKVPTNPVRDVPHRREDNNRVRSLNADEERRLRAVIRRRYPSHEDSFDFALHTGLRQGSQFHLTWEMVDLNARMLRIPAVSRKLPSKARTKNGDALELPLNGFAVRLLRRLHARSQSTSRVFLSQATGKALNYPRHWFSDAVCEARISDFHWHDLRHTFASRLRKGGTRLEDIADLLGHKGLAMTRRYAHTDFDRLRKAVAGLSRKRTDTSVDTEQKRATRKRASDAR